MLYQHPLFSSILSTLSSPLPSSLPSSLILEEEAAPQSHKFPLFLTTLAAHYSLNCRSYNKNDSLENINALLRGVLQYYEAPERHHQSNRNSELDKITLWRHGSTKLLYYPSSAENFAGNANIFIVPSFINRSYIFDLIPNQHSVINYLQQAGHSVFMLEWGDPSAMESGYDVESYWKYRLKPAIDFILDYDRKPLVIFGYCLGGVMAIAAAQLYSNAPQLRGLGLLATPWDFAPCRLSDKAFHLIAKPYLEEILSNYNCLPGIYLQHWFQWRSLDQVIEKFIRVGQGAIKDWAKFVFLEDWLHDYVDLTAGVTHDCLINWYNQDYPSKGKWYLQGAKIDPQALGLPMFVARGASDNIVPPAATTFIHNLPSGSVAMELQEGHLGMIVGSKAYDHTWRPFCNWIQKILK